MWAHPKNIEAKRRTLLCLVFQINRKILKGKGFFCHNQEELFPTADYNQIAQFAKSDVIPKARNSDHNS